jgi:DNA end-binding protein Ku
MAARALGSATISFGLVSIPVKVASHSASGGQTSFHRLHRWGWRGKQPSWREKEDRPVPRDERVKGRASARGPLVASTTRGLEAFDEIGNDAIEIHELLALAKTDPIRCEKALPLGRDDGRAAKSDRLLAEAMRREAGAGEAPPARARGGRARPRAAARPAKRK